jgi:hypothetical protein
VQLHRPRVPALLAGDAAQHLQRTGDAGRVGTFTVEPQRRLEPPYRRSVVTLQQGQPTAAQQGLRPQLRRPALARHHRLVHPVADLVVVPPQIGVPAELPSDPQRGHRVAGLPGEIQRHADVRPRQVQLVQQFFQAMPPFRARFW